MRDERCTTNNDHQFYAQFYTPVIVPELGNMGIIMANVNVAYEDLNNVASQLKSGQQELTDILNKLKGQVDQLVSSGFRTDQASGAFQSSYEQFTTGATQTVEGLDGMSQFLNKTQEALSDLDTQLASALK